MPAAGEEIPVVDFGLLEHDRGVFFAEMRHALCDVGFMQLCNVPGLEADFQQKCFAQAHAFFKLPQEVKDRVSVVNSPHFRGYSTHRSAENKKRVVIASEAFQFGLEQPPIRGDSLPVWQRILRGPNQWPDPALLPEFRSTIEELHRRYFALSRRLGHLICEMLQVDPARYDSYFYETDPDLLASINYNVAPSEVDPAERRRVQKVLAGGGGDWHVDGAPFVTLLIADQPGLEVLRKDDDGSRTSVAAVPMPPGSVTVNIGATLQKLSGGRLRATLHRVNPLSSSGPRVSLPYFLLPRLDNALLPFDAEPAAVKPSAVPPRDRGLAYAAERMRIFDASARRWYAKEWPLVEAAVQAEAAARRSARAAAPRL
eukprot:TRINITY_DN8205_c0_g1_i1.p1 TRINITY_DN8205_c0_g1~~TRINITY_DN8205_c0_g1_i1.p1  ORF type:complete len:397 (+),score=138.29 TRINITY_DN8205_c0_g1_i1:79-1191(+)